MTSNDQDPWTDVRTRHGFPADEVISALQKEIRRGKVENAVLLAYEMVTTSPELENYLWYRLLTISVEDVGWGDLNAPVLIHSLYRINQEFGPRGPENALYAAHAVRYLCKCDKDRSSDEMLNWVIHEVEEGDLRPTIPDYALDMHTRRGKEKGRGLEHFWVEGAKISPELQDREREYQERMWEVLQEKGT